MSPPRPREAEVRGCRQRAVTIREEAFHIRVTGRPDPYTSPSPSPPAAAPLTP